MESRDFFTLGFSIVISGVIGMFIPIQFKHFYVIFLWIFGIILIIYGIIGKRKSVSENGLLSDKSEESCSGNDNIEVDEKP